MSWHEKSSWAPELLDTVVLILHPAHHFPSLLALAVCWEGAEGRGGHRLAAQPHVLCLPGQARVNIQLHFCSAGARHLGLGLCSSQ